MIGDFEEEIEDPEPRQNYIQSGLDSANGTNDTKSSSRISKSANKIFRLFSLKGKSLENDVAELINEYDPEGKQVGSEEREMVHNVMGLGEKTTHDIMIPRTDIVAIDQDMKQEEVWKTIIESGHTRIPVFKDNLDNIAGFLHIKDLLPLLVNKTELELKNIMREILYVPPSMNIVDLLVKMRDRRIHIAVVLDEYGGTEGLLTIEDIVEEIVGDIDDEHDDVGEPDFIKIDESTYQVKARMQVEKLEYNIGVSLRTGNEEEDFDTVGGLIFFMLGRIPTKGEIIEHHSSGVIFEVIDADARRLKKLLVRKTN